MCSGAISSTVPYLPTLLLTAVHWFSLSWHILPDLTLPYLILLNITVFFLPYLIEPHTLGLTCSGLVTTPAFSSTDPSLLWKLTLPDNSKHMGTPALCHIRAAFKAGEHGRITCSTAFS